MADSEIERRLRQAGREFIDAHGNAETAISEAASAGMVPAAISDVSGLSPETVGIFLRRTTPKPQSR